MAAAGGHVPVMLDEMLETLRPVEGGRYLDATFGGGGYAGAILDQARCTLWAIDRDPAAIARGLALAAGYETEDGEPRLHLLQGGFGDMLALLAERGVSELDGVVLDLGVSSFQIDEAERGFSFRHDGPLDMRMSRSGPSAADLVNGLPEAELADVLYRFGEERLSRRIARAVVAERALAPIETTLQLAAIVRRVVPAREVRPRSGDALVPGAAHSGQRRARPDRGRAGAGGAAAAAGRAAGGGVVPLARGPHREALHGRGRRTRAGAVAARSGRPRPARQRQAAFAWSPTRPLTPGDAECRSNPRSRSAKLRALERVPASPNAASPNAAHAPGADR